MPKARKLPQRATRNPELIRGVRKFGRVAAFKKTAGWKFASKGAAGKKQLEEKKQETKQASASSSNREPRWYAADDVAHPLAHRRPHVRSTKLRPSFTPGTVIIILAGRFRGKRAVFLKQLPSGLLLVSGPFEINGVPLRRFNQSYVIATTTRVDVAAVNVSAIDDSFFAKQEEKKPASGKKFFSAEEKKTLVPAKRKEVQKAVDTALLASIKKVENLHHYLRARFSLTKGQKPHLLKF